MTGNHDHRIGDLVTTRTSILGNFIIKGFAGKYAILQPEESEDGNDWFLVQREDLL